MALFDAAVSALVGGSSTVGITTGNNALLGGIWLDLVSSELHTMRNEATRHPMESGGDIVDHVVTKPDTLVLECKVVTSPIRVPESHAGGAQLLDRIIDVPAPESLEVLGVDIDTSINLGFGSVALPLPGREAKVKFVDGAAGRITEVYAELQAIMRDKRLVDIRTTLRDYVDMTLEEVTVPVASGEGGKVMNFRVTAVAIRTASSRIVDAPSPTQSRAVDLLDAGVAAVSDAGAFTESVSGAHQATH